MQHTPTHGLPYPSGTDSVLPEKRDFEDLAILTDAALTTILSGANAYANTGDTATLNSAKAFATAADATALASAKAYADVGDILAAQSFDLTATLTATDNLDQVDDNVLSYIQGASKPATAPTGANSGFVWTRVADSGKFVRSQTYYEIAGERRTWTRTRSGNPGGWTGWEREDPAAALLSPTITSGTILNDIDTDSFHYVYFGDAPAGMPAPVSGFIHTRVTRNVGAPAFVRLQTFSEVGTGSRVWSRSRTGNPGSWSGWEVISRDVKTHPVYLTRPLGPSNTDTFTSRAVRIPFRVPARAHRWRLVFRNINHRGHEIRFPGAVTMKTVTVGDAEVGTDNLPNGSYGTGSAAFPQGRRVFVRDLPLANLANEWAMDWVSGSVLEPGRDYLMSYGYQTDGQPNHSAMAGAWLDGDSATAEYRELPLGSTRSSRAPFDVRLEVAIDSETHTQVIIGDSISAGSNATFPVRDAPANLATASSGGTAPVPNLQTFGGAYIIEWYSGVFGDLTEAKWVDAMRYGKHDRVVLALGSNDIHDGNSLALMKLRYTALIKLVQERLSPNVVVALITPRTRWATDQPEKEVVRLGFNDWLGTLPEGVVGCVDIATPVTGVGAAPLAVANAGDGIHFNTLGSALMGQALTAMARPTLAERDSGFRTLAHPNVSAGTIRVRRFASTVSLSVEAGTLSAAANLDGLIPAGFRPIDVQYATTSGYFAANPRRDVRVGLNGDVGISGATAGDVLQLDMTWSTDEMFPA